jgi:hypothetical protein
LHSVEPVEPVVQPRHLLASQMGLLGSAVQSEATAHSTHAPEEQTVFPVCVAQPLGLALQGPQVWSVPQIGFVVSVQSLSLTHPTHIAASISQTGPS